MKLPPQLTIGVTDTHYGIHGWEDFDRYARCNWALYSSMSKAYAYMTEVDRLRLMLAMCATELEGMREEYAGYRMRHPEPIAPVTGPDGRVYRYVGP